MNQLQRQCAKKLQTHGTKGKHSFKAVLRNIPLNFAIDNLGKVHGQTKNNEKCDLQWDLAIRNFDTSKKNKKCPNWVFDEWFNEGQEWTFISNKKQEWKYYNCQIKYTAHNGCVTIQCQMKHRNPGTEVWQTT